MVQQMIAETRTALDKRLALEVRVQMVRKGAKQADLAQVLGVNQTGVSHRLNGRTGFSIRDLALLADFFGVAPAELLGDERGLGLPIGNP